MQHGERGGEACSCKIKARQGVDVQMSLKGFLVLILGIVVTYHAATFVVTTGAIIMAAVPDQYQWLPLVAEIAVLIVAYRSLPQNDARPLADTVSC